jgi:single-stranded DNA-binding protein
MKGVVAAVQGKAGADPERKTSKTGKEYCRFNLATEKYAPYGERAETQWVTVMVFGDPIDYVMDKVRKGVEVYAEGGLSTSIWEKDGKPQIQITIMAWTIQAMARFSNNPDMEAPL